MATAAMHHIIPHQLLPHGSRNTKGGNANNTTPTNNNNTANTNDSSVLHDENMDDAPDNEAQSQRGAENDGGGGGGGSVERSVAHQSTWQQRYQREREATLEELGLAERKDMGYSTQLRCEDFALLKTLGTGTFARVWLVKLANPKQGDEGRVFALKVLRKVDVIKLRQVEHVINERNVLAAVTGHPFITKLVASFQDSDTLYMLLDYCPGGEVFSYLRRARRFNESTSQFYAAEIVLILEYLHEVEGVAYRDLKPENILIDADGHLKLVDFGFAKRIRDRETYTLCGTPEYLAPEVIRNEGHGCAVDWWAFGILVYEFLVGQPPFWDQNPMKIYEQIVEGRIRFPSAMSAEARDLISGLCTVDVSKRLGNIRGGAGAVKAHPWFRHVDWDALYQRRAPGPIVPFLTSPADTRNFDEYDPEPDGRPVYTEEMRRGNEEKFKDF